jgi:hypothetical protein
VSDTGFGGLRYVKVRFGVVRRQRIIALDLLVLTVSDAA